MVKVTGKQLAALGKETQWKPGQSGNPGGRPGRLPLTDALREALQKPKTLEAIVGAIIKAAKKGSRAHFQEIADRVEGKAMQRHEHSGPEGGAINLNIEEIDARITELLNRSADRASGAPRET